MLSSVQTRCFQPSRSPRVQFGLTTDFSPATAAVYSVFGWVHANRTRGMLVEDFFGMGLLRTFFDLFRGYFYRDKEDTTPVDLNLPAARERMLREVGSILTDNVSAGVAAYGLGLWLDRRYNAFSNRFTHFTTLELFQDALAQAEARGGNSYQAFLREIAARIAAGNTGQARDIADILVECEKASGPLLSQKIAASRSEQKQRKASLLNLQQASARRIAERLGKTDYDVLLSVKGEKQAFALPELLADLGHYGEKLRQPAAAPFSEAKNLLIRTLQVKRWKLWMLGVGLVLTSLVPPLINWITRRVDDIDFYPGELGLAPRQNANGAGRQPGPALSAAPGPMFPPPSTLRIGTTFLPILTARDELVPAVSAEKNRMDQWFPYITRELRNGNPGPLALALLPLGFAVGLLDTVNRTFQNPLRWKRFVKYLRNAYDFGKGAPFTTQQQMASMFAVLISARLAVSRSDNEYRERLVDSFLGWGIWIFGTPAIERFVAKVLDARNGLGRWLVKQPSQLLKEVDGQWKLKTAAELDLLPDAMRRLSKSRHVWLKAGSTVATIGLLGIVEPIIAILWTKRRGAENIVA